MQNTQLQQDGTAKPTKLKKKIHILLAVLLAVVLVCLMAFVQLAFDLESPFINYSNSKKETVMDIRFHHGWGTLTEVRTATDILLLVDAARLAIGQEVVLQRSQSSERLCVKDLQRCWRVVNQ